MRKAGMDLLWFRMGCVKKTLPPVRSADVFPGGMTRENWHRPQTAMLIVSAWAKLTREQSHSVKGLTWKGGPYSFNKAFAGKDNGVRAFLTGHDGVSRPESPDTRCTHSAI